MFVIAPDLLLNESELKFSFINSPGPGGQNVNKVATAALLRFNVLQSPSLTDAVRERLLNSLRNKITAQGDLIIKASRYRTQEANKQDAIERLSAMLLAAATPPKPRKKTKPSKASIKKRQNNKKMHSEKKALRRSV